MAADRSRQQDRPPRPAPRRVGAPFCLCGGDATVAVYRASFCKIHLPEANPWPADCGRVNFSPLSFAMSSDYSTGLDLKGISRYSSLLSFCSVGHDVASSSPLRLRLAGFTSQSIPKPHIYFKRGAAPNWLPIAP